MDITDYICGCCGEYIKWRRQPYRWYSQHARGCRVLRGELARAELLIEGGGRRPKATLRRSARARLLR